MSLAHAWPYGISGDPGIVLFEACLRAWRMDVPTGATVVELGCHESAFAETLKRARPDVTVIGIDARPTALDGPNFAGDIFVIGGAGRMQVWHATGLAKASAHAVVALSSVEHFGLGWYGDPVDPVADIAALGLAAYYLRPQGWLYYDVPWSDSLGYTETNHYRRYTSSTLPHVRACVFDEVARTWVMPGFEADLLDEAPDTHGDNPHPFHYCATLATRRTP